MAVTDPTVFYDAETMAARALVEQLSVQLDNRIGHIEQWQRRYDGDQPLKYASPEFQKHFADQYAGFTDNWCAPVADTTAEKLTVAGLRLASDDTDAESLLQRNADRQFARWWQVNECAAQSSQAFTDACIAKRAFATVWGVGDDERTPEISFETADEVIVGYEPGARRRRKAALKRWTDGDYDYATLYTPDWVWKWQRLRPPAEQKAFTPDLMYRYQWVIRNMPDGKPSRIPNPAGVVPIIELANRPRLKSEPLSEVVGAAAMQDAINALWSYLFSSADFAALPQRVLLNGILPRIPILDKDGQPTGTFRTVDMETVMQRAGKARIMAFEGQEAKIAQWDAADLSVFTGAIEFAVGHLAAQSRTPAHYFTGKIVNVPEGALVALSQAHISKVRERALYHSIAIKELSAVGYLMLGDRKRADAARCGHVNWEAFETPAPGQIADMVSKYRTAGFSFPYIAQLVISDPVELAEEIERHNAEQAMQAALNEFGPKPAPDSQGGGGDGEGEDEPPPEGI